MIKKIIVSFGLLISMVTYAQEGASSPYSFYGIGDVTFKGTVETRSMGGVSVFPDSIHVNLQNPAQYAHDYNEKFVRRLHEELQIDDSLFTMRYQNFVLRFLQPVDFFANLVVSFISANNNSAFS